ncbi:MAG: hypothetical protein AAF514_09725, partial [Verrucomicrobiota bacterium]
MSLNRFRLYFAASAPLIAGLFLGACKPTDEQMAKAKNETLTFNQHIAPLVHGKCSTCHRKKGAGPFSLLTYEEVRKRGDMIVEVTSSGYMPPWLPSHKGLPLAGDRSLTNAEKELLAEWVDAGMPEGDPANRPETPEWPDGWILGRPDLVVSMEAPYIRAAGSRDVWRNFVLPIPGTEGRYVRAVDFSPGNPKAVHHAVIQIDRSGRSRQLEEEDPEPGFSGMRDGLLSLGPYAEAPGGRIIGWTPGKVPLPSDPGLSWPLHPGSDLILQLHLPATGKEESIQSEVAFYFTDEKPDKSPFSLFQSFREISIPAGAANHMEEREYRLPVDCG